MGDRDTEVGGQVNSPEESVIQAEISRMSESYREHGASAEAN